MDVAADTYADGSSYAGKNYVCRHVARDETPSLEGNTELHARDELSLLVVL